MKKKVVTPAAVLVFAFSTFLLNAPAYAQNDSTTKPATQDQSTPPQANQADLVGGKTFTGRIVMSGDKLVLSNAAEQKVYQLDDQSKAKEFLNKNVKITGNLDSSNGMIRISSIEPV